MINLTCYTSLPEVITKFGVTTPNDTRLYPYTSYIYHINEKGKI